MYVRSDTVIASNSRDPPNPSMQFTTFIFHNNLIHTLRFRDAKITREKDKNRIPRSVIDRLSTHDKSFSTIRSIELQLRSLFIGRYRAVSCEAQPSFNGGRFINFPLPLLHDTVKVKYATCNCQRLLTREIQFSTFY